MQEIPGPQTTVQTVTLTPTQSTPVVSPLNLAPSAPQSVGNDTTCPTCHVAVRSTDFFCYNCGHNFHPKPLSTSILKQLSLYFGSVLLPPFGLIWGWPYLKEKTWKAKLMGVVAIILTLVSLVASTLYALQFAQSINDQVNQEMMRIQGFQK